MKDGYRPAGGGAGGRIAIYFQENETSTYFVYEARGGAARGCQVGKEHLCEAEAGGPGTVFLYHMIEEHRTLLIHNGGQKPLVSAIADYNDLRKDGCKAWILPESGKHHFAIEDKIFILKSFKYMEVVILLYILIRLVSLRRCFLNI